MTEKIAFLNKEKVGIVPLFHQIMERDDVEAVVCIVRIDGRWHTCAGGEITMGCWTQASVKLLYDTMQMWHEK